MNVANYLKFIAPIQDQLTGIYSTATLVVTILLLLWVINFLFSITFRIFSLGKSIGGFYRNYIHKYTRGLIFNFFQLLPRKRTI